MQNSYTPASTDTLDLRSETSVESFNDAGSTPDVKVKERPVEAWGHLKGERETLEESKKESELQLNEVIDQRDKLRDECEKQEQKIEDLEKQLHEKDSTIAEMQAQLNHLREEYATLKERFHLKEERIENLKATVDTKNMQIEECNKKIKALESENSGLREIAERVDTRLKDISDYIKQKPSLHQTIGYHAGKELTMTHSKTDTGLDITGDDQARKNSNSRKTAHQRRDRAPPKSAREPATAKKTTKLPPIENNSKKH